MYGNERHNKQNRVSFKGETFVYGVAYGQCRNFHDRISMEEKPQQGRNEDAVFEIYHKDMQLFKYISVNVLCV